MRLADEWLSSYRIFWERRLDSLADHLKSTHRGDQSTTPKEVT
jgi:hypothetical protein